MPNCRDIMEILCKGFSGNFPLVEYKVVAVHEDGVEERVYPGGMNWGCISNPNGLETTKKEEEVCTKLFDYVMGENEQKSKVGFTMPIVTSINDASGEAAPDKDELRFFVTEPFQEKPPVPTCENVEIKALPETTVFVKTFGGFAKDSHWLDVSSSLRNWAEEAGHKVQAEPHHLRACYDVPTKMCNRRNEVWVVKATAN